VCQNRGASHDRPDPTINLFVGISRCAKIVVFLTIDLIRESSRSGWKNTASGDHNYTTQTHRAINSLK
jgi:hypothetical protein